ncbi:hypothetical protein [Methanoregula sp.]|uniref:hypothetical protein n=1 Tax=Methanoregula sp. TaxID=2052170 RepID=UPI003BB01AA2
MTKSKSVTEGEIPLYLLPRVLALHINRMGDSVYRISVKRTHWHHYNISVRTRSLPKELAPGNGTGPAHSGHSPSEYRNNNGKPDQGCEA